MSTSSRRPTPIRSATQPKQRKAFPLRVQMLLQVNGQQLGMLTFEAQVPATPEGEGVQVALPVDARQLQAVLEQQLGPTSAPQQPAKPKLWTPGQGPAPVVRLKD
jgi:hypothetical protein